MLVGERGGLMLPERLPFSNLFTSSSSVHLEEGEALCNLALISLSRVCVRPLEATLVETYSFFTYSGEELPLELPSYPPV